MSTQFPQLLVSLLVAVGVGLVLRSASFFSRKHRDQRASQGASDMTQRSALATALANKLPHSVFFHEHPTFTASTKSYWSQQQREIHPECVIKPGNESEVCTVVTIIKNEFDRCRRKQAPTPIFAVRSGGHSTVPGASNADGGVVVDLSLFNHVSVSQDRTSVLIGCGARWKDVSSILDGKELAVAGGRNSDVGVGGLVLGGGYSYFSPRFGFVCDNVLEYRIILAHGTATTVSEASEPDLWRALKGGGNNFGVVTTFTIRCFPCKNIWSGFLYSFSSKAPQMLQGFHNFIAARFDPYAAGPLLCFSYVQQIGIKTIATQLVYTKPEKWPACWQDFKSIGRVWSTVKVRSLTSTTDELDNISPAGFRQLHISTTVTNDLPTLNHAHDAYIRGAAQLRRVNGMVWTLVLQPLPLAAMRTGRDNILGLQNRNQDLVIILFTAVWKKSSHDELVKSVARTALDDINHFAAARGAADEFRYLNWCDEGQRPFQGYGDRNRELLKRVSATYDPHGLFQKGCVGGFKLH